eukprot:SAG22_NODE_2916_length_2107_cov_1.378984_3_plen_204_part_01
MQAQLTREVTALEDTVQQVSCKALPFCCASTGIVSKTVPFLGCCLSVCPCQRFEAATAALEQSAAELRQAVAGAEQACRQHTDQSAVAGELQGAAFSAVCPLAPHLRQCLSVSSVAGRQHTDQSAAAVRAELAAAAAVRAVSFHGSPDSADCCLPLLFLLAISLSLRSGCCRILYRSHRTLVGWLSSSSSSPPPPSYFPLFPLF